MFDLTSVTDVPAYAQPTAVPFWGSAEDEVRVAAIRLRKRDRRHLIRSAFA